MAKKMKPETNMDTEQKQKPRIKNTPEQKAENHRKDVAYSVGRIQHWTALLVKDLESPRYKLDDSDKNKISQAITQCLENVHDAMAPSIEEVTEKKTFSLD